MPDYTRILVHLGAGEEGEQRKRALERISAGNISSLICAIADGKLEGHMEQPTLEHFDTEVGRVARLRYQDGTTFVTDDWQGPQPDTIDEVGDLGWVVESTNERAIMLGGFPRLLR